MMPTITETISKDHRELANCYEKILDAPDNDIAARWQNQLVRGLAQHLVAEELVVYPAFEKILGEKGRIIANKVRSGHQVVSS
jgi:hemerythrin superfamily protein